MGLNEKRILGSRDLKGKRIQPSNDGGGRWPGGLRETDLKDTLGN